MAATIGLVFVSELVDAQTLTWDASGANPGAPTDGSGNWNTSPPARWSNGGSDVVWDNLSTAVFGSSNGAAGTVTINSGAVSATGVNFNTPGSGSYTIAGTAANALNLIGTATINVASGMTPTINAPITGSAGLTFIGADATAILTLGGVNTYTGNTILDGVGSAGIGGTLKYATSNTTAGTLVFGILPGNTSISTAPVAIDLTSADLTVGNLDVRNNNSTTANTITLGSGRTFTVNNTSTSSVLIGPDALGTAGVQTRLNVTGAGGSVVINHTGTGSHLLIGRGRTNAAAGADPFSTFDLSGITNYTESSGAGNGELRVVGGGNSRGVMLLANTPNGVTGPTNTITVNAIHIANTTVANEDNNGCGSANTNCRMSLGSGTAEAPATNILHADQITIGAGKASGTLNFQGTTGSVVITGKAGGASTANITIGNESSATGSTTASQLLLAGHQATVQAGNVTTARAAGGTAGGPYAGLITFDTGAFTANSLEIAGQTATSAIAVNGRFELGGPTPDSAATGVLTVNNQFNLINRTIATGASAITSTFDINGGTANILTDINVVDANPTGTRTGNINLQGGTLNMNGHNIGSAALPVTNLNLTSGSLTNAGRVAGNTITIGAGLNITGSPTYLLSDAGTLTSNLTTLNLGNGGGIEGGGASGGTVIGNVVAQTGSHITVGLGNAASTLSFSNDLSLNTGSAVNLDLSDNPGFGNDVINVNGNLGVAGTVNLSIGALGAGATIGQTYTIMNYSGILTGNQTNFAVDGGGTRKTFTVQPTAGTPNSIQVLVAGSGPLNLTWIGNINNNWNLNGDANWSGGQKFFQLDNVKFDDTSTNPNPVNLVGSLKPLSVTVEGTRNYTFAGSGTIDGGATLTKNGSGTLTVANANNYTGGTQINGGVVEVGTGGSIGTGDIANSGTLRFNRTDTVTVTAAITGGGIVQNTGSGVTILSSTGNTFSGGLQVSNGTVRSTTLTSAGAGTITVASGGTFAGTGAALAANSTTVMTGGTLAAVGGDYSPLGDLTVNGPITVSGADNAVPTTSRNVQVDGILHGSGNISVVQATGVTSADGSQGFRLRNSSTSTGFSDYTGTVTVGQTGKFELRKVQVGAGSPMGTGKVVMTAGTFDGNNTLTGTYSVFNLRNNTGGNTVFGNDVEITGTGGVSLNLLTDTGGGGIAGAAGTVSTLGNLKIGAGQELALYKATATNTPLTAEFPTVTLTGNGAKFSPKKAGFGAVNTDGTDLLVGTISEQAAGYGITVAGTAPRQMTITGSTNYTGNTKVDSGILTLAPISGTSNLANSADVYVAASALLNLNFTGTDTIDSLFLAGVPAAIGDWGSSLSGAPNVSALLGGTGILHVSTLGTIGVTGDYNNNGVVDAADYAVWRQNVGTNTVLPNDPTGGTIGTAQYDTWKANFGRTPSGSGSGTELNGAVPEPGTLMLVLLALAGVARLRSRGVR